MYRIASFLLCATFLLGAIGCYDGSYNGRRGNDPWWNDRNRETPNGNNRDNNDNNNNDDCRRNRGRVDEGKWRYAVDQFAGRRFRKLKGFRAAKEELLKDLRDVRARACDWERPAVDRQVDRMRDFRFNEGTGGVD